ncbi:MAG: hypothetical protein ACRC62_16550 [Microcoleus sp.]
MTTLNYQLSIDRLSIDRERGRSHYNYQRSIASGDARTTTLNSQINT